MELTLTGASLTSDQASRAMTSGDASSSSALSLPRPNNSDKESVQCSTMGGKDGEGGVVRKSQTFSTATGTAGLGVQTNDASFNPTLADSQQGGETNSRDPRGTKNAQQQASSHPIGSAFYPPPPQQQQQQQKQPQASMNSCPHHHNHTHSHAHSHSHGGHDGTCAAHHNMVLQQQQQQQQGADGTPPSSQHLQKTQEEYLARLLAEPPERRFLALSAAVRLGPYESFRRVADAIRVKEESEQGGGGGARGTSGMMKEEESSELGRYGEDGHTLAHWAAKRIDDIRFIEYLSKIPNIDLNLPSRDSVGMRPLHWAATEGSIPIVALLLRHLDSKPCIVRPASKGRLGDTGSGGRDGTTLSSPLHYDPPNDDAERMTTSAGANDPINARDKSGCTPLLIASQYGHADLAAFLIKRGADPNAVDDSRDTALHWAAYKGSVAVCGLLLHLNGIEDHLDVADAFGQTPLHLASLRGNVEVVQYLLDEAETLIGRGGQKRPFPFLRHRNSNLNASDGNSDGGRRGLEYPGYLLTMRDKDGKTPLDLALKKNKTGCELLLREYMDRHCGPRPSYLRQLRKMTAQMFSVKSWKMWMGVGAEMQSGAQSPKFPFYFVVLHLLLAFLMYPTTFLPIFGTEGGVLWDRMGLHLFTLALMGWLWTMFILTWKTDPGALANGNTSNSAARRNEGMGCLCGDSNGPIRSEMDKVSRRLRQMYDETLESYSAETSSEHKKSLPPLCHSCHIARPLRSKHCRVSRRCILVFDHHCPFVGTAVGLYNYKYFYLFLLTFVLAEVGFISTLVIYTYRSPKFQLGTTILGVYLSLFIIPTFGMLLYHTQLTVRNLTTNEHQNLWRYKYLHDEFGRYHNPFDRGMIHNILDRFSPGESSYNVSSGNGLGMSSVPEDTGGIEVTGRTKQREEEKRDLLHNVV